MGFKILDGKRLAQEVFLSIREAVKLADFVPGLAMIQVGEDPASTVYVNMKEKRCLECGITSKIYRLPCSTTLEELLELIGRLNSDSDIHGILVQLPLPAHIDEARVVEAINPDKDVDCFHPYNVGRLALGLPRVLPCTPAGALALLSANGVSISGKRALVIGRSNIVGKPLGLMLLQENATIGWAHSKSKNLSALCREAEVLFVAIGKPNFIKAEMVSDGAIVVDVGINRVQSSDGRSCLVGDVDFESVAQKTSWITPVPGGVGAMTIAMLLKNCINLAGIESQ